MTVPEAGWYVDPADAGFVRWWDGQGWTEHRNANVPQVEPVQTQYVPMASHVPVVTSEQKLTRKEKDRQLRRNNSFAYLGCVFALLAFIINPFAVFSILGIVFSAIGLSKANSLEGKSRVTGRGTAIAGLILSILGICSVAWVVYQRSM